MPLRMKKTLVNYLGLLGIVSMLSYMAAMCFAPLAFPGYNWLAQAVSDLSADSAPSRVLWNQLSALYAPCGIVCCTMCCVAIRHSYNRILRLGVYLFAVMNWISAVGYAMFPLMAAGLPSGFQNTMHLVVTAFVVLLSIVSLAMMMFGGLGVNLVPSGYFGVVERFSTISAVGFNAVLGVYLFKGFDGGKEAAA